ncbi:MAG: 30S ribosomal protein S20 [Alphaproteobacteria bacterium]|nr:30S ribosomal protein S20 [Alphaproteobacteria bacterium]
MAHNKSAQKRIRQTETRTAINRSRVSRLRTFIKKVETAINNKNPAEAAIAFQQVMPELHRSAAKGYLHKNTAARKLSRLSARIKALSA